MLWRVRVRSLHTRVRRVTSRQVKSQGGRAWTSCVSLSHTLCHLSLTHSVISLSLSHSYLSLSLCHPHSAASCGCDCSLTSDAPSCVSLSHTLSHLSHTLSHLSLSHTLSSLSLSHTLPQVAAAIAVSAHALQKGAPPIPSSSSLLLSGLELSDTKVYEP